MESLLRATIARHGLSERIASSALPTLVGFAELLIKHGKRTNLVGTTDPARLLDEVIVDSLQAAPLLPDGGGVLLDLGSGAGIPGIPLAIARPDWEVVSVEPRAKRTMFQQTARRALGLSNLRVIEGRLGDDGELPEAATRSGGYDAAVTKAVWSPDEWAERGGALVRGGGVVLTYVNGAARAGARASRAYQLADGRARAVVASES